MAQSQAPWHEILTNAIIAALSAGAVAGATDTAKSAIADSYQVEPVRRRNSSGFHQP